MRSRSSQARCQGSLLSLTQLSPNMFCPVPSTMYSQPSGDNSCRASMVEMYSSLAPGLPLAGSHWMPMESGSFMICMNRQHRVSDLCRHDRA